MCSTVIFQYKCGCAERVVFECPFSSTTTSNASTLSHRNCSRRYRIHQQKLFSPENATTITTTPPSQQARLQPWRMELPILSAQKQAICPENEKTKGQNACETIITKLDESCHDCWQSEALLEKQKHASGASSQNSMKSREKEAEGIANNRVLRERAVNEPILPPPPPPIISDSGATSSAERFSEQERL